MLKREDGPVTVRDFNTNKILGIFIPGILSGQHVKIARGFIRYKGKSSSRCAYGGVKRTQINVCDRHKLTVKNMVNSSLLGYLLPYLKKNADPQISKTTQTDMDFFRNDVNELYKYIDGVLYEYLPTEYKNQLNDVINIPSFTKIASLNTNVMVNVDQQAFYHKDHGNTNRYGTIVAVSKDGNNPFKGSEFVLGDYRVAFPIKDGDLLIVDPNLNHGTFTSLGGGTRISLVGFISTRVKNYYNRKKQAESYEPSYANK
jgi:hypothetical protein